MQVWSWDITKLKGPYRGVTYELYVAIDVFSRMIVAWRLEEHEDDALARDMFETAFARHGARPQVVHSDGGSAMTSNTLTELFRELGVEISRNRPRVSNDNPTASPRSRPPSQCRPTRRSSPASRRPALGPPVRRLVQPRALPLRQRGPHPGHRPRRIMGGRAPPSRPDDDPTPREHPERFTRPPVINTPMAQVAITTKSVTNDSKQVDRFRWRALCRLCAR